MGILARIGAAFATRSNPKPVSQSRLKRDLWGNGIGSASDHGLFGLKYDQTVYGDDRAVREGWWFNEKGEPVGHGDLSLGDLDRIREELNQWEAFVVTGAHSNDIVTLGVPQVAENALFVITRDAIVTGPRHRQGEYRQFSSGMIQATMKRAQRGLIPEA